MKTTSHKSLPIFRLLCDGEEEWRGNAYSVDDALDRAFYHESPATTSQYTLEKWNGRGWFTQFHGKM